MKIALFDYGTGNLHSLGKALAAAGATVTITSRWKDALALDALVLPGVGAFGSAVKSLGSETARVREALEAGLPCLGICLGMQLLFHRSHEGEGKGIGFLSGSVRRLRTHITPQMGWNDVHIAPTGLEPLFQGVDNLVAYYANSYVCQPSDQGFVIATSTYQGDTFPAAVRRLHTWGVQFHPEKSSAQGLHIISNFLRQVCP